MNEIITEANIYITKLLSHLNEMDIKDFSIDHVAYRIGWGKLGEGDYTNYTEARDNLLKFGAEMISEEIVPNTENGRPISIYKLVKKIPTTLNDVEYFELPAPRTGKIETEGYTHIEIVIDSKLKDFYLANKVFIDKYSSEEEVMKALVSEDKGLLGNHEIELNFGDNFKIKFHRIPIWEFLKIQYEDTDSGVINNNRQIFDKKFPNVLYKI